jgi:hypothetical protein
MHILSHRGLWKKENEKNSVIAFERSFSSGFGTELDIRDYCGKLVVSHDVPNSSSIEFSKILDLYVKYNKKLCLAINIKSDGLQGLLLDLLKEYQVENYFVFDMSVPDALLYLKNKFKTFTRESEFETEPSFYNNAEGIWMDEFHEPWISSQKIQYHLSNLKKVCIVSPELHGREHTKKWEDYRLISNKNLDNDRIMLCTDYPEQAKEVFNNQTSERGFQ